MSRRLPLQFIATPALAATTPNLQEEFKEKEGWATDDVLRDENTAPVASVDIENGGPTRDLSDVIALAASIDSEAILGVSTGYSHTDAISSPLADTGSDTEDSGSGNACCDDGDDSDSEDDESIQRFLAFANRSRASGSGLPAALAVLSHTVNTAEDDDEETAQLFVTGVAGVVREKRRIQRAVDAILERRELPPSPAAPTPVAPYYVDLNYGTPKTEEELALEACLARLAAFKRVGATRLDGTGTQGFAPAELAKVRERKASAKPLRRTLLTYLCELDIYLECCHVGIGYPKPTAIRVRPDTVFLGAAYVAESGKIGERNRLALA
ncbi:hypothetical protein BV20DRAFT_1124923 [Pilatotrama ljubarskyi]|nr:hypothetical protein BV20DRAFT_1124923 [Pilatotrama ljubarskyi]